MSIAIRQPIDTEKISALSTIARLAGWDVESVGELEKHLAALDPAPRKPHEQLYAALNHGWAKQQHLIVSLDWKSAVSELVWQVKTILAQQGVNLRKVPYARFTPPDEVAVYEDGWRSLHEALSPSSRPWAAAHTTTARWFLAALDGEPTDLATFEDAAFVQQVLHGAMRSSVRNERTRL